MLKWLVDISSSFISKYVCKKDFYETDFTVTIIFRASNKRILLILYPVHNIHEVDLKSKCECPLKVRSVSRSF